MASFPNSVVILSNPTTADTINSGTAVLKHATQHANANDEIEAIENYLLNGVQSVSGGNTGSINVTTTSYADILTQAITTTGGDLLVWGSCQTFIASGTPGDAFMSIRLDSGTDEDIAEASASGVTTITGFRLFTAPSVGAHTVALRATNGAAGTRSAVKRRLLILELRS